jgi:AcrR family transcriptional regulator
MAEPSQLLAEVETTPRARLIDALASSIEQKGYRDTTVADIVRIAKTSRRTFYEHFADRGECFLALFERLTNDKMQQIADAVDPELPLEEQIERAIDVYIDGIVADPELQRSFVRELPALNEASAEALRVTLERYAGMLTGLVQAARERHPEVHLRLLSHDVALILVGGLRELMVISIQQGRDLHELRDSSLEVVKALLMSLKTG